MRPGGARIMCHTTSIERYHRKSLIIKIQFGMCLAVCTVQSPSEREIARIRACTILQRANKKSAGNMARNMKT